jgi:hypothetical protein
VLKQSHRWQTFCPRWLKALASIQSTLYFWQPLFVSYHSKIWMLNSNRCQPYLFTAAFCLWNTWYSDKTSNRSNHIIFPTAVAIVGIVLTMATLSIGARYFALFLMLAGTYGCFQISNAWMANIGARPRKKRAVALAMNNSFGNIALVWTPYLYPSSDGPRYLMGKAWNIQYLLHVLREICWHTDLS